MKKILFVCVENSCRSQMAEGFARAYGEGVIDASSAGSKPSGKINPDAIAVMKEIGIDISGQRSKGFSELPIKKFDYTVSMGCKDVCPFVPADGHISWEIPDPKGKGAAGFRRARDEIELLVRSLVSELLKGERA